MGKFIKQTEIEHEGFDWGDVGWRTYPKTGAEQLVVMDVTLEPGGGHDFHRHPGQEEVIIVKRGQITQYLEKESTTLGVDDSVFIEADQVHASFNESNETALLQVVIAPSKKEEPTGYGLVDVSGEEPWASLRGRSGAAAG
jgi:quercetin dioxygenase-like cupin family protein